MLNVIGYTLRAVPSPSSALSIIRFTCVDLWRHVLTVNRTCNIGEHIVSDYTTRWQVVPLHRLLSQVCVHVEDWGAVLGPHLWTLICHYVILHNRILQNIMHYCIL